ncbi:unnamed protein product, partial [Cyprideis torosa]
MNTSHWFFCGAPFFPSQRYQGLDVNGTKVSYICHGSRATFLASYLLEYEVKSRAQMEEATELAFHVYLLEYIQFSSRVYLLRWLDRKVHQSDLIPSRRDTISRQTYTWTRHAGKKGALFEARSTATGRDYRRISAYIAKQRQMCRGWESFTDLSLRWCHHSTSHSVCEKIYIPEYVCTLPDDHPALNMALEELGETPEIRHRGIHELRQWLKQHPAVSHPRLDLLGNSEILPEDFSGRGLDHSLVESLTIQKEG